MSKTTKNKKKSGSSTIAQNKRARFEFFIEDTIEAGLALQGWEIKSLREGKANISDSYVIFRDGEAYLLGATIQPLVQASSHTINDPQRTRKLLMHRKELDQLFGRINTQGYTAVALDLYWSRSYVKLKVGVAKGKKLHDKRETVKDREWAIQKSRIMKTSNLR